MTKKAPFSHPIVWSNLVFVLVSVISLNPYVIFGGLTLTLGSGWMHHQFSVDSHRADWFGMYFFPSMILLHLLGPTDQIFGVTAVAAGIATAFTIDFLKSNYIIIGILYILACIVKFGTGAYLEAILALAVFFGFVMVNKWEQETSDPDRVHTIKHFVGALGYLFLLI